MPDKALRLYPPLPKELHPTEIHRNVPIIPSNERVDRSLPLARINMVASADGKASISGGATGIGSATDRAVMRNLRAASDAVMVGANTLRAERMSLGLGDAAGGKQPLAVVLASDREAPLLENLILPDDQSLLLVVAEDAAGDRAGNARPGTGLLGVPPDADGRPDLHAALRALRDEHGIRNLLVEGGPTLNRALVSCGLIDEIFLTVAPKLLGGTRTETHTILEGALDVPAPLRLISVHLAANELFLRFGILGTPNPVPRSANFA